MPPKDNAAQERRRYIRLDTVFPVQFRFMSLDGKTALSDWQQGFSNNIGKGGLCLCINNLSVELCALLKEKKAKLALEMRCRFLVKTSLPFTGIAWLEEVSLEARKYLVGLRYEAQRRGRTVKSSAPGPRDWRLLLLWR